MAISKIQYDDKVAINIDSTIPDINKCNASDLNEIKSVVNNNADEIPSNDNLVNVGTTINDKNRVNVLYSHNLFDKNNANIIHFYATATGFTQNNNANSIYIPVEEGKTYTISSTNRSLVDASAGVAYTNKIVESTSDTYLQRTIWSTSDNSLTTTAPSGAKYMYCYVKWATNQTDINNCLATIQIEEGSEATTYEPYVVPSINVDGEEIYSVPKVLWTNPSPRTQFAGQTITLNDNMSNYKFIDFIYYDDVDANTIHTNRIYDYQTKARLTAFIFYSNNLYFRQREIQKSNDTQIAINNNQQFYINNPTTTTQNNGCIPHQIIGYK